MDIVTYALSKSYTDTAIKGAGVIKGKDGESAYQIAVKNGFIGTEQEWLASLEGQDGKTPQKGTDYFTQAEIEQIELDSANKVKVPKTLAELTEDETHRTVTDEEKAVWNQGGTSSAVEYTSQIRDDVGYQTLSKVRDLIGEKTGYVLHGYRDMVPIPDKFTTGPVEGTKFTIFSEPGNCGVIPEGATGTPLYIHIDSRVDPPLFVINGYNGGDKWNDKILIENYDFSKGEKLSFLNSQVLTQDCEITFKNCILPAVSMCGGRFKTIFDHCRFEGNVWLEGTKVYNCYFHSYCTDAMNGDKDFLVQDSYVADIIRAGTKTGAHIDGIQMFGHEGVFTENAKLKNVRFCFPNFHYDGSATSYPNAALMFQQERSTGANNVVFEDIVIDICGRYHPCVSALYDKPITNLMFKNIVTSECYGDGIFAERLNPVTKIVDVRTSPLMYVTSIRRVVRNYVTRTCITCTNTNTKESKLLTVITNTGTYKFNVPRCPSQVELEEDPYYQKYTFKDMPFDLEFEVPGTPDYVICYDGDTQIRYEDFKSKSRARLVPTQGQKDYKNLKNKPSINGQELIGDKSLNLFLDNFDSVQAHYQDIVEIPNEQNCGLIDKKTCTKHVVLGKNPDLKNLIFSEHKGGLALDFGYSGGQSKFNTSVVFENFDFSTNSETGDFYLLIKTAKDYDYNTFTFKNCKFNRFIDDSVYNPRILETRINLVFENCEFSSIQTWGATLDRVLVKGYNDYLGHFSLFTKISNSYFSDNYSGPVAEETRLKNGLVFATKKGIEIKNTVINCPNLGYYNQLPQDGYVMKFDTSSEPVVPIKNEVKMEHCYLIGAEKGIFCDDNTQGMILQKIYINPLNALISTSLLKVIKDISIGSNVLISSVWKDADSNIRFKATNLDSKIKQINVYTSTGNEVFEIAPISFPKETLGQLPKYSEINVEKEYVLKDSRTSFLVFFDGERQIRFKNFDGRKVYLNKKNGSAQPMPKLSIGTVETLAPGAEATASITGTVEAPQLNLGIPQGQPGGSGAGAAYKEVSTSPQTLDPNTRYKFTVALNQLEIALSPSIGYAEYDLVFITSSDGCTLVLPENIKWNGDKIPTLEGNKKYEVVISEGIAYIGKGVSVV